MKKMLQIGTILCGFLMTQYSYGIEANAPQTIDSTQSYEHSSNVQGTTQGQGYQDTSSQALGHPGYHNQGYTNQGYTGRGYDYNQSYDYSRQGSDYSRQGYGYGSNYSSGYASSSQGECCEDQPCADQPMNDCWCLYCHNEPCYYNTWRCVEEPVTCKKRCCRYVPQYYEVQRCKYVPQYYNETCCRYCPQYYDVEECSTCKKWVCDRQCKYVPKYYYKHICGDANCKTPCPQGYSQY